jgi:hypothetical protein
MLGPKKSVDDPSDPDLTLFPFRIDSQQNPLPPSQDAHKPRRMADAQRFPPMVPVGTFGHCRGTSAPERQGRLGTFFAQWVLAASPAAGENECHFPINHLAISIQDV